MQNRNRTTRLTVSALLIAIGILIPIVMPFKIVIEPASFTLASHLPIFIAMFISPSMGAVVSIFTAVGFLLAGFPIVVTLRAFSHIIFAVIGGHLIRGRQNDILSSPWKSQAFSVFLALIHALSEMAVVSLFFFGVVPGVEYQEGFFYTVFLLIGVSTFIHSLMDFILAQIVWNVILKRTTWLSEITAK